MGVTGTQEELRSVTGDGNRWRQYSKGIRRHKAKVNQSKFSAETRVDCCSSQSYEKFKNKELQFVHTFQVIVPSGSALLQLVAAAGCTLSLWQLKV